MDVEAARDLAALADRVGEIAFELSGPDTVRLRQERDRVTRLLRGIVRRTDEPTAPLLAVVGGGSGAGKSTTVNTLAGRAVAAVSVIRPTTRTPTLVCHPDDVAWFDDDRVLPVRALHLATSDRLPAGLALLDTPDVDSVELGNHLLADESLDAADAWVWLATSRTYADEVGMTYLRRARDRHALTAVAITQVRGHELAEVIDDADRLLAAEGIDPALRTHVPHVEVVDDRLPADAVGPLRDWLGALAPADRRVEVRATALAGLEAALPDELATLRTAAEREQRVADRLERLIADRYAAVPAELDAELDTGLSLRADILDRWQRLVGGNEALLRVQTTAGQLGDLVRARLGRPTRDDTRQVQVQVATELTRTVDRLLEGTARAVRRDLESDPVGADLLDRSPGLRRDDPDRERRVRQVVEGWETTVGERIEEVGGPRKTQARRTSTALNAVATSAILVLFTLSGGLTGGEVGIAAAAAAASQWLLVKMFGEHNVTRLLEDIRADLHERVAALTADEQAVVTGTIRAARPPDAVVAALQATGP